MGDDREGHRLVTVGTGRHSGMGPVDRALDVIAGSVEVAAVAVILFAVLFGLARAIRDRRAGGSWPDGYRQYRADLGRGILLGLELLLAADIIGTVAIAPSFESLAVLACIALIRTFLSFALEIELEGRLPWRRRPTETASGDEEEVGPQSLPKAESPSG